MSDNYKHTKYPSPKCFNYMGKTILKEHFRAFIYNADKEKKLVESYQDYEKHMLTGQWFACLDDIPIRADKADKSDKADKADKDKKPTKPKKVVKANKANKDK